MSRIFRGLITFAKMEGDDVNSGDVDNDKIGVERTGTRTAAATVSEVHDKTKLFQ